MRYVIVNEVNPLDLPSKAWFCSRSVVGIVGLNRAGVMNVSYEWWALSGRGLCVGTITRPEESYRLWCVGV